VYGELKQGINREFPSMKPNGTDAQHFLSKGLSARTSKHRRNKKSSRKRHLVATKLKNTPLWLYFRSVRSSEKLVKL
jgi:hypothetical protein